MYDLEVGQIFKNYKEICKWLKVEPTTGKGKKYHLREFERYCNYHKEGQKFIIDEVYKNPSSKIDNRGGNNIKYSYDGLKISKRDYSKYGVYKITKDNQIYIGSTMVSFKERFKQHLYGRQETTKDLLHNGWIFEIIYKTNVDSEDFIRKLEKFYIDYYLFNKDWILINKKEETVCLNIIKGESKCQ